MKFEKMRYSECTKNMFLQFYFIWNAEALNRSFSVDLILEHFGNCEDGRILLNLVNHFKITKQAVLSLLKNYNTVRTFSEISRTVKPHFVSELMKINIWCESLGSLQVIFLAT